MDGTNHQLLDNTYSFAQASSRYLEGIKENTHKRGGGEKITTPWQLTHACIQQI